jgi:hypothetical protein
MRTIDRTAIFILAIVPEPKGPQTAESHVEAR